MPKSTRCIMSEAQMTYYDILHNTFGYTSFRGVQEEIIQSICSGNDTLGLMPTGGGKSITFQVPALAMQGVCIVVTPLIALMLDQVNHLRKRGIQAAAIHSGMSHDDILKTLDNAVLGGLKLLYVAPERLSSPLFTTKLKHMKVSFITVDEAHCICQWGYDFRPSYLEIGNIRSLLPSVPVLALTATATPLVVDDIQKQLRFSHPRVFSMSFERKNLAYIVHTTNDKIASLISILRQNSGAAIVYVRSRQRTKEISECLNATGLSSTYYHAGLHPSIKATRQTQWQSDNVRIIVATNAFGMGIDKADVRLVVHIDVPDSLEAYFQEAGRAGRDGNPSQAIMLYNTRDDQQLHRHITNSFPPTDYIREVYEHLAYYYQIGIDSGQGATFTFDIDKFCHTYRYNSIQVDSALRILDRARYIRYDLSPDCRTRVRFLLNRDQLYLLRRSAPHENQLIDALLRNYGGLFVEYVAVDESFIATQARLTLEQVYQAMKALSHQRIISYIPHRQLPAIVFTQQRIDSQRLVFSPDIYDNLLHQSQQRVAQVLSYCHSADRCRSRMLLAYFGETTAKDCRVCDVCQAKYSPEKFAEGVEKAKKDILKRFSDGFKHNIAELKELLIEERMIDEALRFLISEELLAVDGENVWVRNRRKAE